MLTQSILDILPCLLTLRFLLLDLLVNLLQVCHMLLLRLGMIAPLLEQQLRGVFQLPLPQLLQETCVMLSHAWPTQ